MSSLCLRVATPRATFLPNHHLCRVTGPRGGTRYSPPSRLQRLSSWFHPSASNARDMTTVPTCSPRAFAPLAAASSTPLNGHDIVATTPLEGIIFDMDGTLTEPQNYIFAEMRDALAIDKTTDILEHVASLPAGEASETAHKIIRTIERRAMAKMVPQAGLVALLEYLDRRGIKKAILTRNFEEPVTHLTTTHIPTHLAPFSPIVTRAFTPPKPSPAGLWHIAAAWGISVPQQHIQQQSQDLAAADPSSPPSLPIIMVGDSVDDIAAGRDAGALTVLVRSAGKEALETDERTDVVITHLHELIPLFDSGIASRR